MGIKVQIISLLLLIGISLVAFFAAFGNLNLLDSKAYFYTNGILLLLIGFLVIERHFTKQRDIVLNSIVVIMSLAALQTSVFNTLKLLIILYSFVILILTLINIFLMNNSTSENSHRQKVGLSIAKVIRVFGQARVMFSITFFYGILEFHDIESLQSQNFWFLLFWAFIMVWEPLGIGNKIEEAIDWLSNPQIQSNLGTIVSSRSPDVVHCEIIEGAKISTGDLVRIHLKRDESKDLYGIVLNVFYLDTKNWANVKLIRDLPPQNIGSLYSKTGEISKICIDEMNSDSRELLANSELFKNRDKVIGIVDINSSVNKLRIQITRKVTDIEVGSVIWIVYNSKKVFYQICEGTTHEDLLQTSNKYGYVTAHASQLGIWDDSKERFDRVNWVPELNAAAFWLAEDSSSAKKEFKAKDDQFLIGYVPGTNFPVWTNLKDLVQHHCSILGITGCGKTTFEMDMIRAKSDLGVKVLCFDITGDYAAYFSEKKWEYNPFIEPSEYSELYETIDSLEKLYSEFANKRLYDKIKELEEKTAKLLENCAKRAIDSKVNLFLIEIEELANLTNVHDFFHRVINAIFLYKKKINDETLISIVFEEAHTIIPERSSFAVDYKLGDRFVNKISQITLQGRKYSIGFTIITQRTANVSKTILNQCNTVFSFSCFDNTAKEFLSNYYGDEYTNSLSSLKKLQILAAGKAVNSDLPIIAQIPLKEEKEIVNIREARKKLAGTKEKSKVVVVVDSSASPADKDDDFPFDP